MLIELNQEKSTKYRTSYDVFTTLENGDCGQHIGYIHVHHRQKTTSFALLPPSSLDLTESNLRAIADAMKSFAIINKYNQPE